MRIGIQDQSSLARLGQAFAIRLEHLDDAGTAEIDVLVKAEEITQIQNDDQDPVYRAIAVPANRIEQGQFPGLFIGALPGADDEPAGCPA